MSSQLNEMKLNMPWFKMYVTLNGICEMFALDHELFFETKTQSKNPVSESKTENLNQSSAFH